jgi:hypothetical protein
MNHSFQETSIARLANYCMVSAAILFGAHSSVRGEVVHPSFAADQVAFFEQNVRPLLEQNCVRCHGGQGSNGEVKVRSGLQMVSRKGLVLGGEHGSAFNAEDPGASLLLEMVSYKDEHHEMPPTGKLEPAELEVLEKWVDMGMPWTAEDIDRLVELPEEDEANTTINEHTRSFWSHTAVAKPEIPKVSDPAWQKHPIDALIYARLEQQGLKPNSMASKETLIRRAYYNLTGLPPTPEAVATFVNDSSPDAWPKLIDELLESPRYGEHWARHWLDIVRYAESNGFERDSTKEHIWRYRDYVIDAFNSDKPYDQFIKEQLAGDELDNPTPEALIATGYHRLMQWDDEPADRPQHVYDVLDDNVRVTSEGMLAMTLGCARCHDHKGDPISQKDYYNFVAFFNGVTQMDKQNVIQPVDLPANPNVIAQRQQARNDELKRLSGTIEKLQSQIREQFIARQPDLKTQLSSKAEVVLVSDSGGPGQIWRYTTERPGDDWFNVGFRPSAGWKSGKVGIGRGDGGDNGNASIGTELDFDTLWMQTTFSLTEVPSSLQLFVNSSGTVEVYLNGQPIQLLTGGGEAHTLIPLDSEALTALQTGRNVVSVHVTHSGEGNAYIDLGLREIRGESVLAQLIESRGEELPDQGLLRRLANNQERLKHLVSEPIFKEILAMTVQERGTDAGELFVHIRGSVHAPGDKVSPGVPQIIDEGKVVDIPTPPDGAKTSGRRRILAEWIADPDNRRTSRVMVNRLWQHHFGRAICPTPSDFGYLGELPTHPELIDWLARSFTDNDWKIKDMHRLLMSSLTYQMASSGNALALQKDPANQLFWRFPMRRLTAEEIRDSMIAVTGKMNTKLGGKSFFPVLDKEVLATSSTKSGKWASSPADELERRSIYIHIKRSLKPPELESFDFADTDGPCAARFVTTVPTQALAMLNSRHVNDQAKKLAERLRSEEQGSLQNKVTRALELTLTRKVDGAEVARGMQLINDLQKDYSLTAEDAFERFCLVALNLNEFVYLD